MRAAAPGRSGSALRPSRWLGHLWAAPLTIAGVVVATLLGARCCGRSEGALELLAPARGPLAWFFRSFGVAAYTWGATIVYRDEARRQTPQLRRHERAHVRQCLRLGPLMLVAYPLASLWALWRGGHGYRDNAFERAARAEERGAEPGA